MKKYFPEKQRHFGEHAGITSNLVELDTVFDAVDSEVGPDVHPNRDNSPGLVHRATPTEPDLPLVRDTTSGPRINCPGGHVQPQLQVDHVHKQQHTKHACAC
jgi:hypothetical protein